MKPISLATTITLLATLPIAAQTWVAEFDGQLRRQYAAPLVADELFISQEALDAYIASNPRAYGGQIVTLAVPGQDPALYMLLPSGQGLTAGPLDANAVRHTQQIWTDTVAAASNAVPATRTITINGLTKPLSENISFDVAGGTGDIVFAQSNRLWVDWRNETGTENGTIFRPFTTVQAALDAIGGAADTNAYMAVSNRYYIVEVAPGIYVEHLTMPYRPHIAIELRGALIAGDVSLTIPELPYVPLNSRLVIRGDSMRAGLPAMYPQVGVFGAVRFTGATQKPASFHVLEIDRAYAGAIEFGDGAPQWAHVFLDRAQVGPIVSTNTWAGVSLFVQGWGMGHTGGGPAQQSIGPIIGNILPYNLQSTSINGMELTGGLDAGKYMIWHNVRFETNGVYNASVGYDVHLDTASYNSWIAATSPENRGNWHAEEGGNMIITDATIRQLELP